MTWSAVPRTVNRLVVDVDAPFDDFRARYEQAVPAYDLTRLAQFGNWDDVQADADRSAPNGFLRYGLAAVGLPVGLEMGFSSAGAGAIGALALMGLTTLTPAAVVGTDLAFGLGLSLVGGGIHAALGSVKTT